MLPVLLRQGLTLADHRLQFRLHRALRQGVRRIYHHRGRRLLVDQAPQCVLHGGGAAHLGGLDKDNLFRCVVGKGVHDLHQVRGDAVPPRPRYSVPAWQDPVPLRPHGHAHPLPGPQYLNGRHHPPGHLVRLYSVLSHGSAPGVSSTCMAST